MGAERVPEYLTLRWVPAPSLKVGLTFDEVMNEDIVARLEQAEFVAVPWLEQLGARSTWPVPAPAPTTHVAKAPRDECWDEDACGKAVAWPNTTWVIYVDSFDCGDYCYWGCSVYDTKTGRTADPAELPQPKWSAKPEPTFGTCASYPVDASGTAIVVNEQLCRGHDCAQLHGHVLGFLEPGPTLVAGP